MLCELVTDLRQKPTLMEPLSLSPPWTIHDRVNAFVIQNRTLYWREFTLPSYSVLEQHVWLKAELPNNRIPLQVKADYENLMVLDTQGDVHYVKSSSSKGTLMHKPEWQSGIWDLPVISELFNRFIFRDPNFKVSHAGAWTCSYLETGCFYVDAKGEKHELGSGKTQIGATTTAYVADSVKRRFRYYDPYIPKWSSDAGDIFIPFPETSHSIFDLVECASCRSGVFSIGYDVTPKLNGGVIKNLVLYFISADANLLRLNPGISYTYSMESEKGGEFALPAALYQKISLPKSCQLTKVIGMERAAGQLMTDIVLTIEGKRYGDVEETGFFFKKLNEENWSFEPVKGHAIQTENLLPFCLEDFQVEFKSSLRDYQGLTGDSFYKAELNNFGPNALESVLTVFIDDKPYRMSLYTTQCQWDLLGFNWQDFTLVVPKESRTALGWEDEVVVVTILARNNQMYIKRKSSHSALFQFQI